MTAPDRRFTILSEHAHGGLGLVSRAQDNALHRLVALKQIRPDRLDSPRVQQRFLNEAEITGQLEHPGIVPVYALEHDDAGLPYYVMRFVQGRTLSQAIAEHQRDPQPARFTDLLRRFESICQTIAYAHDRRVVHRDLKPANIMLGDYGETLVLDWGLAKRLTTTAGLGRAPRARSAIEADPVATPSTDPVTIDLLATPAQRSRSESGSTVDARAWRAEPREGPVEADASDQLTEQGTVLGTPAYMSPEQARGDLDMLDERCDVFALGAILCELLTGKPPYVAEGFDSKLQQAARGDLSHAETRLAACGADPELVSLVRACLAPEPDARPRNAGEVAGRVAAYQASMQERLQAAEIERAAAQASAAAERRRRRAILALATCLIVLFLGAGGVAMWYYQHRREATAQRQQAERDLDLTLGEATQTLDEVDRTLLDPARHAEVSDQPRRWQTMLASVDAILKRAEVLLQNAPADVDAGIPERIREMRLRLKSAQAQRSLVAELDEIRVDVATRFDYPRAVERYAAKFRKAGFDLDLERLDDARVTAATARLRTSPLRWPLIAFMDHWANCVLSQELVARSPASPIETAQKLYDVTRAADPDPWRDRFRDAAMLRDTMAQRNPGPLEKLAADPRALDQSQHILGILTVRLGNAGGDPLPLLHAAMLRHPRDFWLLLSAGAAAKLPEERLAYFRAALALRPESAIVYANLGHQLLDLRRWDEAIDVLRKSVELNPTVSGPHNNLGWALCEKKRFDEGVARFRAALAIDPHHSIAASNIAEALQLQGKTDEAVAECRKYLASFPGNGHVLQRLQRVLAQKMPDYLQGKFQPRGPDEQRIVAELCAAQELYRAAVDLYVEAFAANPQLGEDPHIGHRWKAARAAAHAAAGRGKDAGKLDDPTRAALRTRAHGWLRADLAVFDKMLSARPDDRKFVEQRLQEWQQVADLADLRVPTALAKLPGQEQMAWNTFWADVARMAQRARSPANEK